MTFLPEPLVQIQNNFMELFLMMASTKITQMLLLDLIQGSRSAASNVSGNRCKCDCRSRGHQFNPGLVPYFRGDLLWNNFNSLSPPFRWIIQEGLLSVTSKIMYTKYWLTACSSLSRKKSVVRWTDRPAMTIDVYFKRKATKPNK